MLKNWLNWKSSLRGFLLLTVPFLTISCTHSQVEIKSQRLAELPHPPAYIVQCFESVTQVPTESLKSREQVLRLIATLRRSEVSKHRCGRDMLVWYDKVRTTYGS